MKNTKPVVIEKLSNDSLKNISGGVRIDGLRIISTAIIAFPCILIIGGFAGTIGCAIASGNRFSNGKMIEGSGFAAAATASAGAVATGIVLLKDMLDPK